MTILLTSSGFSRPLIRDEIIRILPYRRPLRVAYISTASKVVKDQAYAENDVFIMKCLGFEVNEIDIAEIKRDALEDAIKNKDIIYVQGGNGYYLLKQVQESGFTTIVKKAIDKGIIYIGRSAGSYIMCPSIEMITWFKKWEEFGVTDLTALWLVPFLLTAHYTDDRRARIKEGMKKVNYPVRGITNDQALLVTNDMIKLLGKGSEIIF